jgi:hypothetical protein
MFRKENGPHYAMLGAEGQMRACRVTGKEIAYEDVILDDSSVLSRQWVMLPRNCSDILTTELLVESYLAFVKRCSLSVVHPVTKDGTISFNLLGFSVPLLIFRGPEFTGDNQLRSASLRIEGGFLVQRNECGRGMLSFTVSTLEEGVVVTVQVSDYCPLLLGGRRPSRVRSWLYRHTQAIVHKLVTIRFLAHVCRKIESGSPL